MPSGAAAGTATVTFIVFVLPGCTRIVVAPGVALPPGRVVEAVNARSLAPSMIGSTKLPKALGIDGIMNSHTIVMPWSVNILL